MPVGQTWTQIEQSTQAPSPRSTGFTDRERAAFAVCEAITLLPDEGLPPRIYEAAREHFDDEELAQLIFACIVINAWNRVAVPTHMVPEE